jgi:ABC-type sugar transport system ATPase subunit
MTVAGNLAFPLKMRGTARAEIATRVGQVADLLEISGLLDRLPKQRSGGQRQRVAMGRALVRRPTVFLLDEPLSNLDARLRVQVRAEIGALQQRTETTMMYVTHDQVEAMTLGQRVAVMDRGMLQQCAPPAELYAQPVNTFVAGFIGNPPMNLLPAQVDGTAVLIGEQRLALRGPPPAEGSTIGIRPEALALEGGGDVMLEATVAHVEWLGHETLVHASVHGVEAERSTVVARVAGMRALASEESVSLRTSEASLYWFGSNGKAI